MRFIGMMVCGVFVAAIIALILNPETIPFAVAVAPCGVLLLLVTRFADRCFVPTRIFFRTCAFSGLLALGVFSRSIFSVEAAPMISGICFYFGVGFVAASICSMIGNNSNRIEPNNG